MLIGSVCGVAVSPDCSNAVAFKEILLPEAIESPVPQPSSVPESIPPGTVVVLAENPTAFDANASAI